MASLGAINIAKKALMLIFIITIIVSANVVRFASEEHDYVISLFMLVPSCLEISEKGLLIRLG